MRKQSKRAAMKQDGCRQMEGTQTEGWEMQEVLAEAWLACSSVSINVFLFVLFRSKVWSIESILFGHLGAFLKVETSC